MYCDSYIVIFGHDYAAYMEQTEKVSLYGSVLRT